MKTTHKARPLGRNPISNFAVDIILPFHGCYDKLYQACKSIWHNTAHPYRLFLVDDASPNKTYLGAFEKAPNTVVIQNEEQLGFGASLWEGFKEGNNSWVVFMHSDCEVNNLNWLSEMYKTYLNYPKAGIVAPRTDNPVGSDKLKAEKTDKAVPDFVLGKEYLPLYCALCPRDIFLKINGFVKSYPFRYYEDEELAYRMRHYGYQQVVSGATWVKHSGSSTVSSLCRLQDDPIYNGPDYKQIIEENRIRCIRDMQSLKK